MNQAWYPLGGNGGLPSDLMTDEVIGRRMLKVSSESAKLSYALNEVIFAVSSRFTLGPGELGAINLTGIIPFGILQVSASKQLGLTVRSAASAGSLGGVVAVVSKNLARSSKSRIIPESRHPAIPLGSPASAGTGIIEPYVLGGFGKTISMVVENTMETTQTVEVVADVISYAALQEPEPVFIGGQRAYISGNEVFI